MKGYKIYFTLGLVLMLVYLVAQYNKPVPTDWSPSYAAKDKIPFGTYILYNRITDILPKASIITSKNAVYNTLKNKKFTDAVYLIIADKTEINQYDFNQLKKFMEAGNQVFIASNNLGRYLSKVLKIQTDINLFGNGSAVNFTNPLLKTQANYGFEKGIGNAFFKKIDTAKAIVLGVNGENKANFLKYPFGKGNLFLISDPGFYTNFNLLDKDGAEYAAKSLSYINGHKKLIFDGYFSLGDTDETDLFRVFFKHPELKYAYYLAIFSLLLFVLYDIKRRQRIIPVADPFINSSLAFANVVGSVYYQERNNLDLARKKISYFMEHLRSRYYLKTNEIDGQFPTLLMQKTGINEVLAKTLTRYFKQVPEMTTFNDTDLINLNESIEQFYKQTQPNGAGTI